MRERRRLFDQLLASAAVVVACVTGVLTAGQVRDAWKGVLDEHPVIQYATRPTTDRVAKLGQALAANTRSLQRDPRSGYLRSLLEALDLSPDSQLLVFSKTGVQSAYTSPRNPRALFFDKSVVVGYVPGAPVIEMAAHDPQQGVVFYTVDQNAATPRPLRRTSCLSCHVSASTLYVPGIIARSNVVGDDGSVLPQTGTQEVTHGTPHPDRWGGWFVTTEKASIPYAQRAHEGNITFSGRGNTSNQVFVDWLDSAPETRGYLSSSSDIATLLVFDHQMHAVNLLTRLNWESRIAAEQKTPSTEVIALVNELADYLLFVGEMPPLVQLVPLPGFADHLEARTPKDRRGRSLAQLDLDRRLMRYPCSYMVYSEAFDGLPRPTKDAVYRRMLDILSGHASQPKYARLSADDRRAVLEILHDTKPDFPRDTP
jgi:hypothetical protein